MAKPLILVIGATGNVGGQITRHLLADNQDVRVLVRDPAKYSGSSGSAQIVKADLLKPDTLEEAFDGVDKAFIVAPPTPELMTMEANAFMVAQDAGVKHIVYLSNFGAGKFGPPVWDWHGASERKLEGLGVPWSILRPARFMTDTPFPWNWFAIKEQSRIYEATAEAKFTAIAPADIGAVAAKVLTSKGHEGKTYELTSDEALTGREMAAAIASVLGRNVTFVDVPPEKMRETMTAIGIPEFIVVTILRYCETLKEGRWYLTPSVRELLGRRATSYEAWLQTNAESLKAKLAA